MTAIRALIVACTFGALTVAVASPTLADVHPDPAANAFGLMKEALGIWRPAENSESPLRIRFSLTAGGTVLVEEWTRNGQPHSLTLYHRDGRDLIATHYCPQGNQPRLAMVHQIGSSGVRFALKDVTDLDADHESHAVAIAFDMSEGLFLVRQETYRQLDVEELSELRLVRVP